MKSSKFIDNTLLFIECAFLVYWIVQMIRGPSFIYIILILAVSVAIYMNLSGRDFFRREKTQ